MIWCNFGFNVIIREVQIIVGKFKKLGNGNGFEVLSSGCLSFVLTLFEKVWMRLIFYFNALLIKQGEFNVESPYKVWFLNKALTLELSQPTDVKHIPHLKQ